MAKATMSIPRQMRGVRKGVPIRTIDICVVLPLSQFIESNLPNGMASLLYLMMSSFHSTNEGMPARLNSWNASSTDVHAFPGPH